ncbi:MAG: ABC transporter substrate-binding protein [Leptospiraceae bacterium]|nr:ABC transporter substrate-binding protein [Leptospiraceae bacterium]
MTEALFAVGAGDRVVGSDTSSVYPQAARNMPKVGYQRKLSAEGILSLKPDIIIGTHEAGPPEVIAQLKASGVPVVLYEDKGGLEGAYGKILFAGKHSGNEDAAQSLVQQMKSHIQGLKRPDFNAKVLFIYARGPGMVQVSGKGTPAHDMIELAGAQNAMNSFQGFRPLTAEALVAANPDIILIPSRALQSMGGESGLLKVPGVALTDAGKNRKLVVMDDLLLLGFSARTHIALEELIQKLNRAR